MHKVYTYVTFYNGKPFHIIHTLFNLLYALSATLTLVRPSLNAVSFSAGPFEQV
jgi:hypothetical protein